MSGVSNKVDQRNQASPILFDAEAFSPATSTTLNSSVLELNNN